MDSASRTSKIFVYCFLHMRGLASAALLRTAKRVLQILLVCEGKREKETKTMRPSTPDRGLYVINVVLSPYERLG